MSDNDLVAITPDNEQYHGILEAMESGKRSETYDYNKLADAYNDAPVGSVILIKMPPSTKTNNVVKVLNGRELNSKVSKSETGEEVAPDFSIKRLIRDAKGVSIPADRRPLALTKNSDAKMRKVF